MKMRISRAWPWLLLLLIPAIAMATLTKHVKHPHWTNKYDQHFRKYSKHYFGPHWDWHWFKAQGIAESGLKPNARNKSSGALGIMQILPSTYREIQTKNKHFRNIRDPRWNIAAGIYYDRQMYLKWKQLVSSEERLNFAFASYNAGYGKVRKAYRKVGYNKKDAQWKEVARYAPLQTRHYLRRIHRLMDYRPVQVNLITTPTNESEGSNPF